MMYVLRLKTGLSRVDALSATSIEEARDLFIARKQMELEFFDRQYVVTEWNDSDILKTADNLDTPYRRQRMRAKSQREKQIKKGLFKKQNKRGQ